MENEFQKMQRLAGVPVTENKKQLDENFVGLPMVGNIFDREKADYEIAYEHYLGKINENKIVDDIKNRLDALGVKYEISTTDKIKPFKVIYKPIDKSDEFYDKFENIVDLFGLKGVVKSSSDLNESINPEVINKVNKFIKSLAKLYDYSEQDAVYAIMQALKTTDFKGINEKYINEKDEVEESFIYEEEGTDGEENPIDSITMDIPLFIRMLEFAREDASTDMDLHDLAEKAIDMSAEGEVLSMDDYEGLVGGEETTEEI